MAAKKKRACPACEQRRIDDLRKADEARRQDNATIWRKVMYAVEDSAKFRLRGELELTTRKILAAFDDAVSEVRRCNPMGTFGEESMEDKGEA